MTFLFAAEIDWESGQVSGTVYNGDPKLTDLMSKVCIIMCFSPVHVHPFLGMIIIVSLL